VDKVFRKTVVQKQAEKNRWQNEGSGIAPTDHITSISVYSFRCFNGKIGSMPLEIELKARLDESTPVEQRLSRLGTYCHSYKKSDSYWFPVQIGAGFPPSGVRVRRESGTEADGAAYETVLVTYKQKEITDGIEVNDEREFTVSAALPFEDLLTCLGLHKGISKEKQGRAWTIPPETAGQSGAEQPPILAELSLVTGLGWFLELEIIAEDDGQTVEESRKRLLALLEKLEIPADRIESKPYTTMLREKK
jgi:adenylate cyclase class 2